MKVGIVRERKSPPDFRVPFSPEQVAEMMQAFPEVSFMVESSPDRCFSDAEYVRAGVSVVSHLQDADVLLGVKEIPSVHLIPEKTYVFFSHTIKKQPYNKALLQSIVEKRITLLDYECFRDATGERVVGFGRYAGIVGVYNGLRCFGQKTGLFQLPAAYLLSRGREEANELLRGLPTFSLRVLLTGRGRVAHGAMEMLDMAGFTRVDHSVLASAQGKVYSVVEYFTYNQRKDGGFFNHQDFVARPEAYASVLPELLQGVDLYVAGHFWSKGSPVLLTNEDLQHRLPDLQVIADISCDVGGPIASTLRATTMEQPFYGFDPTTAQEVTLHTPSALWVMAVDNLPCELPRDASISFGEELRPIIQLLLAAPEHVTVEKATLVKAGVVQPTFSYLADWLTE
jgi:saccharopine dehydrogenase (NAD+, L-lysine-forming)